MTSWEPGQRCVNCVNIYISIWPPVLKCVVIVHSDSMSTASRCHWAYCAAFPLLWRHFLLPAPIPMSWLMWYRGEKTGTMHQQIDFQTQVMTKPYRKRCSLTYFRRLMVRIMTLRAARHKGCWFLINFKHFFKLNHKMFIFNYVFVCEVWPTLGKG